MVVENRVCLGDFRGRISANGAGTWQVLLVATAFLHDFLLGEHRVLHHPHFFHQILVDLDLLSQLIL